MARKHDTAIPAGSDRTDKPVTRTRRGRALENGKMSDCQDAADEIAMLRAMLARESESAREAGRLMSCYAERYGFLLGGLEMVATGHTTAERVLEAASKKYGNE